MAYALFGIDANAAMQVVMIGFVISVVQDSAETALNSSTDVLFTAATSDAVTPLCCTSARTYKKTPSKSITWGLVLAETEGNHKIPRNPHEIWLSSP